MEIRKKGKRGRRGSPESWSVDSHVGARIRTRRMLLGMSQGKLGDALGLTFQQVQKYEHGVNRITAGMLYQLSRTLDVPISFFFDCYENADGQTAPPRTGADTPIEGEAQISRREARMLRLWRNAPDSVANEMLGLLTSLAQHSRLIDEEDLEEEDGDGDDEAEDDGGVNALSDDMSETARAKRRRRRGAAWDPADIE
jgi:transcriptional regulator with XRE-family HTH domain